MEDRRENTNDPVSSDIRELFNHAVPSEGLKNSIVEKLKNEGLLKTENMNKERFFWMAATVAGILAGFFGSMLIKAPDQMSVVKGNQYLLLLREDSTFAASETDIPRLIEEYTDWATKANKEGTLVGAEKLTNETVKLGKPMMASLVSGYFIITAPSLQEATTLANTHPHLRYNGNIELKPIEQLN